MIFQSFQSRGMGDASVTMVSPTPVTSAPVDCATQQAELAALKANVLAKGGTWNVPDGQSPFGGAIPPCVNAPASSSSNTSGVTTTPGVLGGSVSIAGTNVPTEYLLLGGFGLALVLVVALSN